MNSPSIEAVNLSKRYGSFLALSNLSLKIEGSKCVGFLGPNGAGKTTTLKIFTDMIRASEGKALINGIDVHLNKKKALSSVGSLIESHEIYPSLTPREALSMIDHGKLLVYDRLSNVMSIVCSDAKNIEEIELLRDIDERSVNDDIASLANVNYAERSDPSKMRIHFSGGIQNQERLLLDLANLKIGMISFHPSASALEETYLRLIKDTL